jgi:2'-5' RNA ligase
VDLAAATAGQAPVALTATGPVLLGRGVAVRLESAALLELRQRLAAVWAALLGAQDRQAFRPHITVQNKVAPVAARALHAELAANFRPFPVEACGLLLWRYIGGQWERVATLPFQATG